jgi:hypothetical protein
VKIRLNEALALCAEDRQVRDEVWHVVEQREDDLDWYTDWVVTEEEREAREWDCDDEGDYDRESYVIELLGPSEGNALDEWETENGGT